MLNQFDLGPQTGNLNKIVEISAYLCEFMCSFVYEHVYRYVYMDYEDSSRQIAVTFLKHSWPPYVLDRGSS